MAKRKQIGQADMLGDKGIALIHRIVNDMGFVWNAVHLEAGIDGIIEVRDEGSAEVLNCIIQVQSKAGASYFKSETDTTFEFRCNERDLDYWLGGNAPVILVVSRPDHNEAYWVAIKEYFKDPTRRERRRIEFDKTHDRFEPTCRDVLAALAAPTDSAGGLTRTPSASTNRRFRIRGSAPGLGPRLIGREDDLAAIKGQLQRSVNDHSLGIVVIQGVGGVGKSSIVNHLAYDESLADMFPDGCLWVGIGNSPEILHLLQPWAQALKVNSGLLIRINDAVGALRAKLRKRRVLLLVDDIWELAHAESFRVGGPQSAILYTTRSPELANQLAPIAGLVYALSGLETEEAIKLLASFAPDVVTEHRVLCEELVDSVDGLPLAISVAGRVLKREQLAGEDIETVIAAIQNDARTLLHEPVPPDMVDLLKQTTPEVAAVLRRSTTPLNATELWCFAKIGMYPPAPECFELTFTAGHWGMSLDNTRKIAKRFVQLGLIENPRRGWYRIHPLMKALALHEMDLLSE